MNNIALIEAAAIAAGIAETEIYHTFNEWKKAGYIVKKGEKAAFKATIWKRVEKFNDAGELEKARFILKEAHFFLSGQVKKM